jgi:hypothetical protein
MLGSEEGIREVKQWKASVVYILMAMVQIDMSKAPEWPESYSSMQYDCEIEIDNLQELLFFFFFT